MVYPSLRDWLFSVKTFAAAMLALYLGLAFQLPRPYWAMATVYIVSNPFVGATRSKALYRALGTALGASAAVLLVPPFVESPYLFSVIVALWTGTLLYLAISDRTARSYVFMLAGYTMPIIALPSVTNPTAVFDLAVTRTEEILLGIVCAAVVGGVASAEPARARPSSSEPTDGSATPSFYATETLSGRIAGASISACRQRLAATINGLELLLSQLAYDHTRPDVLSRAQDLRGRMQLLLPIMSSLADPLISACNRRPPARLARRTRAAARRCRSSGSGTPLRPASQAISGPISKPTPARAHRRVAAAACDARQAGKARSSRTRLWRLKQVIDVWQDCRTLRRIIVEEDGTWQPRISGTGGWAAQSAILRSRHHAVLHRLGGRRDGPCAAVLWISSGWNDGAGAITLAAIACCFFAALDEPAPQVFKFFTRDSASVVLAGLYLFVVLPNVHDFPMLVILFAASVHPRRHADPASAVQSRDHAGRGQHRDLHQHSGCVRRRLPYLRE
jgi:uncharacterized membrane protein YccC